MLKWGEVEIKGDENMIQLTSVKKKQPYQIEALKGSQKTNVFFKNIG